MKIVLVCAAGLSSSLVVSKMKAALTPSQKDWVIEAHPIENLDEIIDDFDVILLGPQMAHKLINTQKAFASYHKPIAVISSVDYALGNGRKIMDQAIALRMEAKE